MLWGIWHLRDGHRKIDLSRAFIVCLIFGMCSTGSFDYFCWRVNFMKCVVLCEFFIVFQRKLVQRCFLRFSIRGLYHKISSRQFFGGAWRLYFRRPWKSRRPVIVSEWLSENKKLPSLTSKSFQVLTWFPNWQFLTCLWKWPPLRLVTKPTALTASFSRLNVFCGYRRQREDLWSD